MSKKREKRQREMVRSGRESLLERQVEVSAGECGFSEAARCSAAMEGADTGYSPWAERGMRGGGEEESF